jgi:hypothetical protein
VISLTLA